MMIFKLRTINLTWKQPTHIFRGELIELIVTFHQLYRSFGPTLANFKSCLVLHLNFGIRVVIIIIILITKRNPYFDLRILQPHWIVIIFEVSKKAGGVYQIPLPLEHQLHSPYEKYKKRRKKGNRAEATEKSLVLLDTFELHFVRNASAIEILVLYGLVQRELFRFKFKHFVSVL